MITIFNVIYAKPVWTRQTAIAHMTENGVNDILQCEETDGAMCFTLTVKQDDKPSRLLQLTDSVCLVIKDLNIPDAEIPELIFGEPALKEEEKKSDSV
jgi:hypothetical protein